jgi:hypothetical protein
MVALFVGMLHTYFLSNIFSVIAKKNTLLVDLKRN